MQSDMTRSIELPPKNKNPYILKYGFLCIEVWLLNEFAPKSAP
jgi:hypothetical protein